MSNKNNKNNTKTHDLARCGMCGDLVFLPYIHRDDCSPNGWICDECELALHPEWETNEW